MTSHLLDIYDCWLHVATDRSQLARLRRKYGPKKVPPLDGSEFGASTKFHTSPDDAPDQMHLLFWLDVPSHRGNAGQLLDTIAHEATHGACLILDDASAKYDGESEPLAYLVGWLTRWLWETATAGRAA